MSERMDFSNGYINADGSVYNGPNASLINQQVSNAWSTFSQDYAVLRFYAVFNDPTDEMVMFGSFAPYTLELNIINPDGRQFFDPNTSTRILPGNMLDSIGDPMMAFDSWFTIGVADDQNDPHNTLIAINMPESMVDGVNITPGAGILVLVPTIDHDNNPDTPE